MRVEKKMGSTEDEECKMEAGSAYTNTVLSASVFDFQKMSNELRAKKAENIVDTVQGSAEPLNKTEKEWRNLLSIEVADSAICGKVDPMRRHATSCPHILESPQRTKKRDSVFAQIDAAKARVNQAAAAPQLSPFGAPMPLPAHSPPAFAHSPPPGLPLLSFSPLPESDTESSLLFDEHRSHNKHRRTSSTASFISGRPTWASSQQDVLEQDLCKLFVANGWSGQAVGNPETKMFFDKYLPQAKLPDRRVLSDRILFQEFR
ncbi:hypothetical protein C8J57DRAFT_1240516 [Mycena rebaudengoi]|nr:hypothetical protein C8J57DRAFT_1240516 [Mycena rebaudengoi]